MVAYPEEPSTWSPYLSDEPAVVDLAALWGLPLYRVDHHGQLRPGLAESVTIAPGDPDGPWTVRVRLREGEWTDGRPVVASDVAATLEAVRADRPVLVGPLEAVEVVDDRTVELRYARPYARWAWVLAGGFTVLPAHVLADGGLEAFAGELPVTGGPFRLVEHEPDLRLVFEAHATGPTGAPRLGRVEVLFVPDVETALGLVRDGRADVVAGYLAVNPLERAARVDGTAVAAPLGGTTVGLRWSPRAGGPARRHDLAAAVDIDGMVEGLLGRFGSRLTSVLPVGTGPWRAGVADPSLDGVSLSITAPRWQEAAGYAGRVVQRELVEAGADVDLLRLDPREASERSPDGEVVIRRLLPRPALADLLPAAEGPLRSRLVDADAVATVRDEAVSTALDALHADGRELPLFRMAVAHAWDDDLAGVRPSAWPGLALWDAAAWHWNP